MQPSDRQAIAKTWKLYIGGKFPRTESGRYYTPVANGRELGNVCQASRKDFRDAVVAARSAQPGWAERSAYNRSQILYRIGEILEGRRDQFVSELQSQGLTAEAANQETNLAIDRWIYYAGWCDKYQQVFGSVNPVATSHFNFSCLEPTGVVSILASRSSPLLGLVSLVAPVICSGNTCVALGSHDRPLSAITLAEVLATSDVPGGVVNILTGSRSELQDHFASHMDVNAIAIDAPDAAESSQIRELCADNVKRYREFNQDWLSGEAQHPWMIEAFCEVKTTWHPIEAIGPAGSGY